MKKLLSIAMATALVATCTAGITAGAAAAEVTPAPAAETAQVYLVPGTWYDGTEKETKYNTVEGATALTSEEKTALHLEAEPNVYKAGAAGTTLPTPATTHTDAEGEPFVFQGWWYIENATVTYAEKVPATAQDLYLYADFRAAASCPSAPSAPPSEQESAEANYILLIHKDGTSEKLPLLVSGTDAYGIDTFGYDIPVQFSNEYFELRHGDTMQFFFTQPGVDKEPASYPKLKNDSYSCAYETGGKSTTADWLTDNKEYSLEQGAVTVFYRQLETRTFRIYLKVRGNFSGYTAGTLAIYLEPKN